jgi:CBS domain-containing protein
MTDRHLRHLPVLDNEKLVGFISIGDLVKAANKKWAYKCPFFI